MMEESTKGRHEATGRGVMYTVEEACRLSKVPLRETRIVVQGFGNVGHIAAQMLFDRGARITAISDSQGGIFNSRGINPYDALKHKTSGSVVEMPGTSPISSRELLESDCDILIPAALKNQITQDNALRKRARIVAEGANGPVTPTADRILYERSIFLIPDVLCNAGGVTVSYFEWVQ